MKPELMLDKMMKRHRTWRSYILGPADDHEWVCGVIDERERYIVQEEDTDRDESVRAAIRRIYRMERAVL